MPWISSKTFTSSGNMELIRCARKDNRKTYACLPSVSMSMRNLIRRVRWHEEQKGEKRTRHCQFPAKLFRKPGATIFVVAFPLFVSVFSMAIDNVDRVTVRSDEDWEKGFIPWLENHEKHNIGVEDGVFVVSDLVP